LKRTRASAEISLSDLSSLDGEKYTRRDFGNPRLISGYSPFSVRGEKKIFAKREKGDPLYIFTQNHTLFLFVQSYIHAHIRSPKRKRDKVHAAREELSSSSEEENKDLSVIKVVVDRHKQQAKISSSRFFFILLNTSLSSPIFEW
jgi:hypothetical protein